MIDQLGLKPVLPHATELATQAWLSRRAPKGGGEGRAPAKQLVPACRRQACQAGRRPEGRPLLSARRELCRLFERHLRRELQLPASCRPQQRCSRQCSPLPRCQLTTYSTSGTTVPPTCTLRPIAQPTGPTNCAPWGSRAGKAALVAGRRSHRGVLPSADLPGAGPLAVNALSLGGSPGRCRCRPGQRTTPGYRKSQTLRRGTASSQSRTSRRRRWQGPAAAGWKERKSTAPRRGFRKAADVKPLGHRQLRWGGRGGGTPQPAGQPARAAACSSHPTSFELAQPTHAPLLSLVERAQHDTAWLLHSMATRRTSTRHAWHMPGTGPPLTGKLVALGSLKLVLKVDSRAGSPGSRMPLLLGSSVKTCQWGCGIHSESL